MEAPASELELHPAVTVLVGENGSGKSTLLEALAVVWGFNPEGGTRNFHFQTRRSHSVLREYLRIVKSVQRARDGFFLRAESSFNVASQIEHLDEEPSFGPPIRLAELNLILACRIPVRLKLIVVDTTRLTTLVCDPALAFVNDATRITTQVHVELPVDRGNSPPQHRLRKVRSSSTWACLSSRSHELRRLCSFHCSSA